jgi:hypothetical protein
MTRLQELIPHELAVPLHSENVQLAAAMAFSVTVVPLA